MAYHIDKATGDLVIDGFQNGIAASPHKGIAHIQNANISTEANEVMCTFGRVQQSQTGTTATTHTIADVDSSHLSTTFALVSGVWIVISSSTISGLSAGTYYIQNSTGTGGGVAANSFQISNYYNSSVITGFGATGSATFTLLRAMGQPLASATEAYHSSGTTYYRYYILDSNGLIWVQDSGVGNYWVLPDASLVTGATGLFVLNGWLHILVNTLILCKPTVNLADSTSTTNNWTSFAGGGLQTSNTHFGYVGHQGRAYITDGSLIASIFPNTSLVTANTANVQSYASYTGSGTTGTISQLIDGTLPYNGVSNATRIPAVFFHALTASAANPTALTQGTIYYIKYLPSSSGFTDTSTFEVYAAASGGAALDLATGTVGTQYFSTYYPVSSGGTATITFTPQRLNLPFFENATAITEIGNTAVIGTTGNVLYPWNQVDALPGDLIPLPENNTTFLLTVNNMAYVFAGNKGNIYITNGSTASLALSVPDYCAGIAGTPSSYIEPYFVWGGAMYLRGRVYFSILDERLIPNNSGLQKAGNCGGVWSFVPTQNFYIGQDTGLALRLENQNSYGTYSGVATVLLPSQTQTALFPQYWTGWYSTVVVANVTYGLDFTGTATLNSALIETDLIPTGTLLKKESFKQIEYKLAAPLVNSENVTMKYRLNATDAYTTCGTAVVESASDLAGYFSVPFQNTQWLQLQASLNPQAQSAGSFVRLIEIRVR